MNITQSFILAMKNLMLSKMRSLLTMLGIIIGVGAVITIISLGDGLYGYIKDQFQSMGSNLVIAQISSRSTARSITPEQLYQLVEENPDTLQAVSPYVPTSGSLKFGTESYNYTSVVGVAETYLQISASTLADGRYLQYLDVQNLNNVCIVGSYVANTVMGGNPVGKTLKIGGYNYTVVGELKEKAGSYQGSDDDYVYIPYTNATRMNKSSMVAGYYFSAINDTVMDRAQGLIEQKLLSVYQDENSYYVMNMAQLLSMMDTVNGMTMTILIAIAGISLMVGGIGIMNIMLVTVTERTREIGIRKSLGAKRKDIRTQFIIEAGATSAVGGIIGIILGASMSGVVGNLLGITAAASLKAILVAFTVSVAIGVIFGYLPANKAAKLNPIDALRYE